MTRIIPKSRVECLVRSRDQLGETPPGAIDAQDNPLPDDKLMKFYEVTDQIVLTGHNIGFGASTNRLISLRCAPGSGADAHA